MRKLGIALLVAAATTAFAPSANAADAIVGPCASVSEMFEDANVQMPPTHPAVGMAYGTVCRITG